MEERQEKEEKLEKNDLVPEQSKIESMSAQDECKAEETLSKRRQKKLLRAQRNNDLKEIRRKQEKETRKANRLKKRLAGEDLGKEKREAFERPRKVNSAKLVIDLSFDELMTEKELISMGQQLGASYNLNKLSCNPFSSIIFTGPPDKSLLETSLGMRMEKQGRGDWRKWKSVVVRSLGGLEGLNREQDDQEAICKKEQLVYLTADSDTTIESVEGDKVYIIGGLVDRNRHKRLCADKAERLGIKTARLPIDPTRLIGSTVLTVNGVVNILLTYNETLDWEKTFDRSLPKRKVKAVEALPDDDDEEERYNNRPAM